MVRLRLADRAELAAALADDETSVIAQRPTASGRQVPRLLAHPRDGYLVSSPGHGLFHISSGADLVRCAPNAVAHWRWQRSLLGEVLPLVCALRGLEALHASAVIPGAGLPAIAVAATSGGGKSSVAAELILRGATLLADDVTAVETGRAGVVAHPALGLMSLASTAPGLDALSRAGLGVRVGSSPDSVRVSVRRQEKPVRLGTIYFLQPAGGTATIRLTEVRPPDPRLLLASTFNIALRTRQRLITQLDTCAAIARSVRMVRVGTPPEVDFSVLAGRLLADAEGAGPPETALGTEMAPAPAPAG